MYLLLLLSSLFTSGWLCPLAAHLKSHLLLSLVTLRLTQDAIGLKLMNSFINFLLDRKAEVGGGGGFEANIWNAVAVEMLKHTTKGSI
jgi:hypothetical protein